MSDAFIKQNPNTFAALYRSVLTASQMASQSKDRELIAKVISPAQYLNQPETVIAQVLTGKFADGLGGVKNVPDRANFDPVPWQSMAVWMLTQMKRWGYIKGDVNYRQIAEKVFMLTDAKKYMAEAGFKPPEGAYRQGAARWCILVRRLCGRGGSGRGPLGAGVQAQDVHGPQGLHRAGDRHRGQHDWFAQDKLMREGGALQIGI